MAELSFVFDEPDLIQANGSFTPNEERFATVIGGMWSRFASGNPPLARANSLVETDGVEIDGTGPWPKYSPTGGVQVVLRDDTPPGGRGSPFRKEKLPRKAACDFWFSVGWR